MRIEEQLKKSSNRGKNSKTSRKIWKGSMQWVTKCLQGQEKAHGVPPL